MHWRDRLSNFLVERRADERRSVLLPAIVHADGGEIRAILLDISRSGAMLAAVEGACAGTAIKLVVDEGLMAGRIIWSEGYRFGVNFDRKLSLACFDAIVERAHYDGRAR